SRNPSTHRPPLGSAPRGQDHRHVPALEERLRLDAADILQGLGHADQHVPPDLRVGHLPSAEHHGRLDLVALLKEAARVADLELEVVLVDAGPELDFLDLDLVLLLPRLAGLAGLLVLVLAVVHDPDHRRPRVRRHLHQIETLALGDGERFVNRHYAELDDNGTDDPTRAVPDMQVPSTIP